MSDDITAQVTKRVDEIRQKYPSVSLDYLLLDGEYGKWGVILYTDYDFTTRGLDFIESKESWKRPEAVEQYNGLIGEGYCVVIYAPGEVLDDLIAKLKREGGRTNIRLASIEEPSRRHCTLKEAMSSVTVYG